MIPAIVVSILAVAVASLVFALHRVGARRHQRLAAEIRGLATTDIHWRATEIPIVVVQRIFNRVVHVRQRAACLLTSDHFYCISDEGKPWGARVDLDLVRPALVADGLIAPAPTILPLVELPDGLLLQLRDDLVWHLDVPDAAELFARFRLR